MPFFFICQQPIYIEKNKKIWHIYIHLFDTASEFNEAYNGSSYEEPWLSLTEEGEQVKYNKSEREKLLGTPLTFNIISAGTINWVASTASANKIAQYKLNDGDWTSITSKTGTSAPSINVVEGDKLMLRGNNSRYATSSSVYSSFSGSTAWFSIEGNIMSLINSENYSTLTSLTSTFTFLHLFGNCTGLTSAKNLILPAIRLSEGSYYELFNGCTSLAIAPELPATILADSCYFAMFEGCTSLTSAPELPATTLVYMCYYLMFSNCTSLTSAPELPATTLERYCYGHMFKGCSSLKDSPDLRATVLQRDCYAQMFAACTSLTKAPALPATALTSGCYRLMFSNCTSLTSAPELPATTLVESCYYGMFSDCSNLNFIKCLATDISANMCVNSWVARVPATTSGTFVKNASMSGWSRGLNGIPTRWTIQDA